jgi:PhoPQ-activated pathogenicity-related protein
MVDPFVYREKLTLPKMLIHGTNDPYWPQDAMNSYWDDLKGEKHVLYVPNAGHNLREVKGGKPEVFPARAINTLSAFARSQVFDKPLPKLTWKYTERADGQLLLEAKSDQPIKVVRTWEANATTRDFRKSEWKSLDMKDFGETNFSMNSSRPLTGLKATYCEAEYEIDGLTFSLSTQIRIQEAKK